jgi:NAD(P) transhydrogenase subunit alpha
MSVTNAISGIVVVAAVLQITDATLLVQILAAVGVLLGSINVFGGFAVTSRMLKMFTKGDN